MNLRRLTQTRLKMWFFLSPSHVERQWLHSRSINSLWMDSTHWCLPCWLPLYAEYIMLLLPSLLSKKRKKMNLCTQVWTVDLVSCSYYQLIYYSVYNGHTFTKTFSDCSRIIGVHPIPPLENDLHLFSWQRISSWFAAWEQTSSLWRLR